MNNTTTTTRHLVSWTVSNCTIIARNGSTASKAFGTLDEAQQWTKKNASNLPTDVTIKAI